MWFSMAQPSRPVGIRATVRTGRELACCLSGADGWEAGLTSMRCFGFSLARQVGWS